MTFFRSLTLANFAAALYSVRQQDFTHVETVLIGDNDTGESVGSLFELIDELQFPVPVQLFKFTGNEQKTHSFSTNQIVRRVKTPWVFFTRADYILKFDALKVLGRETRWDHFGTSYFKHLHVGIERVEQTSWRQNGTDVLHLLTGIEEHYGAIDAGVWILRKDLFDKVGGLDERLTAWGHAQTHFQHKLYQAGVGFKVVPEVLFFHPLHGGPRDLALANMQLSEIGIAIQDLWDRYTGPNPYR